MIGSAVAKHFLAQNRYETSITSCDENNYFPGAKKILFNANEADFTALPPADYVINCIGVIKPFMARDPAAARMVNALFPWRLAGWAGKNGTKIIHTTTDCVFSGRKGRSGENDPHDALDEYGKTKSLGEPSEKCMVLRTSVIGEELRNNANFVEWAKSQKGKEVNGFINHFWNGVTAGWYARICEKIIIDGLWEPGIFHIYAADTVSKYQMLQYLNRKFELGLKIRAVMAAESCDRSLVTVKPLCGKLMIPDVAQMVEEM
jgi:dTDP-4-dehydrorhamnose reductase